MMQFLPTTEWLSRVACIPMRLLSPTVQPWARAQWPTVTFLPRRTCPPGSQWRTALSCTLQFSPSTSVPSSPRSTAPYQMFVPLPSVTSPSTVAFAATKTAPSSRGVFPPKERIIVEKPPFSFASFMVFFIIAFYYRSMEAPGLPKEFRFMKFTSLRCGGWLALALTAVFLTTAALSGFAVYAMPIQAAYPQESIYLFDADTGGDPRGAESRPSPLRRQPDQDDDGSAGAGKRYRPQRQHHHPGQPHAGAYSPSGPTGATPSACRRARRCAAST